MPGGGGEEGERGRKERTGQETTRSYWAAWRSRGARVDFQAASRTPPAAPGDDPGYDLVTFSIWIALAPPAENTLPVTRTFSSANSLSRAF